MLITDLLCEIFILLRVIESLNFSQSLRDFCTVILFQDVLKYSGWDPAEDRYVAHDVEASWSFDVWDDSAGLMLITDPLCEIFLLLRVIESLNFSHPVDVFWRDLIGCCWSGRDPDVSRGKQLSSDDVWHQYTNWWRVIYIRNHLTVWKPQWNSAFIQTIKDEHNFTFIINLWVQIEVQEESQAEVCEYCTDHL